MAAAQKHAVKGTLELSVKKDLNRMDLQISALETCAGVKLNSFSGLAISEPSCTHSYENKFLFMTLTALNTKDHYDQETL